MTISIALWFCLSQPPCFLWLPLASAGLEARGEAQGMGEVGRLWPGLVLTCFQGQSVCLSGEVEEGRVGMVERVDLFPPHLQSRMLMGVGQVLVTVGLGQLTIALWPSRHQGGY